MEPIQPLLASAIARIVRPAPLSIEKVLFAWRVTAGPALAKVTRVTLTAAGMLEVDVDDVRWRDELERSTTLLLDRMRDLLGPDCVQGIVWKGPARSPAKPRGAWRYRRKADHEA